MRPKNSRKSGRISLLPSTNQTFTTEANFMISPNELLGTFPIDVKVHNKPKIHQHKGADKGYTDLLTTTTGVYGKSYREKVSPIIKAHMDRLRKRHQYWALYYNYLKEGSEESLLKAQKIKENNLGYKKINRRASKLKALNQSLINKAINDWFKTEPSEYYVLEDLSWQSPKSVRYSKSIRDELSHWDKGYLQERIEFKAHEQGSKVIIVNPAYTSQICHKCQHFGIRAGKQFTCEHCQLTFDADQNAAFNIEARASDSEITTFTKYQIVKSILEKRLKRM